MDVNETQYSRKYANATFVVNWNKLVVINSLMLLLCNFVNLLHMKNLLTRQPLGIMMRLSLEYISFCSVLFVGFLWPISLFCFLSFALMPSSLGAFSENFRVALDILKAFDKIYHISFIFKLYSSYGFYPVCIFISNFLSDQSNGAVVDGYIFPLGLLKGVFHRILPCYLLYFRYSAIIPSV